MSASPSPERSRKRKSNFSDAPQGGAAVEGAVVATVVTVAGVEVEVVSGQSTVARVDAPPDSKAQLGVRARLWVRRCCFHSCVGNRVRARLLERVTGFAPSVAPKYCWRDEWSQRVRADTYGRQAACPFLDTSESRFVLELELGRFKSRCGRWRVGTRRATVARLSTTLSIVHFRQTHIRSCTRHSQNPTSTGRGFSRVDFVRRADAQAGSAHARPSVKTCVEF